MRLRRGHLVGLTQRRLVVLISDLLVQDVGASLLRQVGLAASHRLRGVSLIKREHYSVLALPLNFSPPLDIAVVSPVAGLITQLSILQTMLSG